MRRDAKRINRAAGSVVENLEARTLLSVWAGTWRFQGVELNAEDGSATYAARNAIASITDTGPGQYEMNVNNGAFIVSLWGDDTQIGMGSSQTDEDQYVTLRMVDPGVIVVGIGSVGYGYFPERAVSWANFVGGIATQRTIPITTFAWDGEYTAHAIALGLDDDGGTVAANPYEEDLNIIATPVGFGRYSIGEVNDDDRDTFIPSGSKLISRGRDGQEYWYDQVWRGPYGRLYHVGGGVEFGTVPSGQTPVIVSGWFDVAYTDPHVNVAPSLNTAGSPQFSAINEDDLSNSGTSVHDLLAGGGTNYAYDPNVGNGQGIALVATDNSRGTWQYSTDGGATWNNVVKASPTHALLLDENALIRFQPKANYFGTRTKAIWLKAWDQTSGDNGSYVSVVPSGGQTPYSRSTDTAGIVVNAVNDAPVLSISSLVTGPLLYGAGRRPISVFYGMRLTDVDSRTMTSATVEFSGGYTPGTDVIAYRGPSSIAAAIDPATGVVTLTSATPMSILAYVYALKGIYFSTPAQHADVTITFTVVDNLGLASLPVDRTLQIIA